MSTQLRDLKLIDLEAPSLNYDARVKSACSAFDNQMYEVIDATGVVRFIPNIMGLTDSNLVDILAWQFHVDFYDSSKSLEFRKRLVQMSIQWHITKGTYQLVKDVLDTYWPGGASLLEWFDYYDPLPPGKPPDPAPVPPPPAPPQSPVIVPAPPGTWHDRYRFRIYVDEQIIDPADEEAVLRLVEQYKPISRWPDQQGVFRANVADCSIGWTGAMLRFVIHESAAPDTERHAQTYQLSGPASGAASVDSELFSVSLPSLTTVPDAVTVTPNDGGGGGTFTPATVQLTTDAPVAQFSYKPASAGAKVISATNDGGLTNPAPVSYQVKLVATTYSLSGPASGVAGVASTPFTVALPPNTITATPVTVTPNDGGAGGTFTPASVQLYATRRERASESATFTYTPAP
jgi:Phage tail protein (Tail_P2_I)